MAGLRPAEGGVELQVERVAPVLLAKRLSQIMLTPAADAAYRLPGGGAEQGGSGGDADDGGVDHRRKRGENCGAPRGRQPRDLGDGALC
jgi:hypothetical protein